MKKHICISLFLSLFVPFGLRASYSLHPIENLHNQLSNTAILCMHQDRYGYMWFGTYDGLNLYNGRNVEIFRFEFDNKASLLGNCIYQITDAEEGYLWISTQLGLTKFSLKEQIVTEAFPEYKKNELIASDSQGKTWLVSRKNYLSCYMPEERIFHDIYLQGTGTDQVREIFVNLQDEACLVMANGTVRHVTLLPNNVRPVDTSRLDIRDEVLHERNIIRAFYGNGLLYFIDSEANLYLYDLTKDQKLYIRNMADLMDKYGQVADITFFQHDLFIAFVHNGLLKLSVADHYAPEVVSLENGIFCLLKDRNQEALWVGTDGRGVDLYFNEKEKFGNILLENLPVVVKKPIRTFFTDDGGSLWFGTKGDGIIRIRDYQKFSHVKVPETNVHHFVTNKGLYENPVFCFRKSKFRNDLWIGTNGGISYYSYNDEQIHMVKDLEGGNPIVYIHSLVEIDDSTLWIATVGNGIRQIIVDKSVRPYRVKSKRTHIFRKDDNVCDEFYSMIYDGDSTLLVGSRGGYGVIRFNIYSKAYSFLSMNNADNKAIGDVLCVYQSRDSVLYVGASSGLTTIRTGIGGEDDIHQFNRRNGIINDMIHGILEDKHGMIWMSTNKGLVKYNPQNGSFYNYSSPSVGVHEFSDDAYWHCPYSGRLFFGGVNGLIWVEPKEYESPVRYEPDLLFYNLKLFNRHYPLYEYNGEKPKKLKLSAGENTFTITFTVPDYIDGDNYDFSYMLENYNSDWVALQKNNEILFTNLPYGDYTLKVKYKNDATGGGDRSYSLPISVLPPWYLSAVAIVAYILLFLAGAAGVAVYVYRKLQKRQRQVAARLREEQKEKLLESKLRFFTNVSHELFTPLTLIKGACEQIAGHEDTLDTHVGKYVRIMENNVVNLTELIQEIVDFRKIEESETLSSVIREIPVSQVLNSQLLSFEQVAIRNKITLLSDIPENLYWNTDRSAFKKIVLNLLSNAFKYTNEGGTVNVTLSAAEGKLTLKVYNTGRGIEKDKISSIFDRYSVLENTDVNAYNQMTSRNGLGLYICHSMVMLLQGEIDVSSTAGEYAEFTVILPQLPLPVACTVSAGTEKTSAAAMAERKQPENANQTKGECDYVLVVDDNREITELVSDILSPYYTVMKANHVNEAMELIRRHTFCLIITDIMMPEIDGLTFVNMIRKDKYTRHLPVVAVSAKTHANDHVSGYNAGVDAYLKKPFSSEVLLSVVNRLIANKNELKEYFHSPESAFQYTDGVLIHQEDKDFMDAVTAVIEQHIGEEGLRPEFVAEKMGISPRNLYRQFKRILSVSPSDFIKDYKFTYAAKLLVTTNLTVQEIIYRVGISNRSYFYKEFTKKYAVSPKKYRSGTDEEE